MQPIPNGPWLQTRKNTWPVLSCMYCLQWLLVTTGRVEYLLSRNKHRQLIHVDFLFVTRSCWQLPKSNPCLCIVKPSLKHTHAQLLCTHTQLLCTYTYYYSFAYACHFPCFHSKPLECGWACMSSFVCSLLLQMLLPLCVDLWACLARVAGGRWGVSLIKLPLCTLAFRKQN